MHMSHMRPPQLSLSYTHVDAHVYVEGGWWLLLVLPTYTYTRITYIDREKSVLSSVFSYAHMNTHVDQEGAVLSSVLAENSTMSPVCTRSLICLISTRLTSLCPTNATCANKDAA